MKLKSIKQIKNLDSKLVLVRVDYNVTIKNGRVLDTERIERSYSTINYLLKKRAKIILMAHLGRPKGEVVPELSLKPIVKYLNKITRRKVKFVPDCLGSKVLNAVSKLKAGQILLLENLRFYPQEKENESKFARQLADLADIYVNSAFSVSHRAHASVSAITRYLPAYAGLNLLEEVEALSKVIRSVKRPAIAIIGGVKIATKINVIENLAKKYDYILLGGALVNNFFRSQNLNIGKSIYDPQDLKLAKKLYQKYKEKIVLPIDVRTVKKISAQGKIETYRLFELNKIKSKNFYIIDIGPKTQIYFESFIKQAQTLVLNGPMGMFEIEKFSQGSNYIAQAFALQAKGPAFGVVGGGETLTILEQQGLKKWPDFVSTAGGAMLEFLEGKTLPGIKPLKNN